MSQPPWAGFYRLTQLRRWQNVIPQRFSCRVFSAPADVSQLAALNYTAQRVCLPGVRIAISSQEAERMVVNVPLFPKFEGVAHYAVLMARRDLPQARILAGISGEAFVLEAMHQGVASCWMAGNFRRSLAAALCREEEQVMAVLPLGQPRDPHGARQRQRKDLGALCQDDPAAWPHWAYVAAEAVRKAPSAMNRQPWRMSFTGNTLQLSSRPFGSLDDGIAILHLEAATYACQKTWRYSQDGKSVLLTAEENHEPV